MDGNGEGGNGGGGGERKIGGPHCLSFYFPSSSTLDSRGRDPPIQEPFPFLIVQVGTRQRFQESLRGC